MAIFLICLFLIAVAIGSYVVFEIAGAIRDSAGHDDKRAIART